MITSLNNARVKYVRRLQVDKRFRSREQVYVIEGTRWVSELALLAHAPQFLFYTEAWLNAADNAQILQQLDAPYQGVSDEVMAAMSDTETPPGVLAIVPMHPRPLPQRPSLLLILDRITNPGNLGTMLRTAGAAGVEGVLLGPGCVDAYNPKAVRGGMGAHLKLPIHEGSWGQIREWTTDLAIWLAAAEGDIMYTAVPWTKPAALIIGGEARGAGRQAYQLASNTVSIPMHAATESLNAAMATAVILFEAARQRGRWPQRPLT